MKIRKALTLVTALALTAALAVGGTLAYLTAQTDTVTNTFTVGNVSITLDEAKVDVYGNVDENTTDRVTANTYKLIPGHEYIKDPIVTVEANSEDCYVFVKIENDISGIEDSSNTIENQVTTTNGWTKLDGVTDVYYQEVAASNEDQELAVFGSFKIASDAEVADYSGKTIDITAYAIQQDGFDDAAAAWEAAGFDTTTATDAD